MMNRIVGCSSWLSSLAVGVAFAPSVSFAGLVQYRAIDLGRGAAYAIDNGRAAGSKTVVIDGNEIVDAGYWTAGGARFIDVNRPVGGTREQSSVLGIRGNDLVGVLSPSRLNSPVAWSGKSHAQQEINDIGSLSGVDGGRAVGTFSRPYGVDPDSSEPTADHAVLLIVRQTMTIDLHPAGHRSSAAYGISGDHQVGQVDDAAALWSGSADSYVSLNGPGVSRASATAIAGRKIAGYGLVGADHFHALLWNDLNAESTVDLHPIGYAHSFALGVNSAGRAVGYGDRPAPSANESGDEHALLWVDASPEHVIDLNEFLPAPLRNGMIGASAIDEHGNIAGFANGHAMLWVPINATAIPLPAGAMPGSIMLAILGSAHVLRRCHARFGA